MKVIIAGSRECTNYEAVKAAIEEAKFEITEVVSGDAQGVDHLGERWADEHGIPVARFPADWVCYGEDAGRLRNEQMAEYSDALIAVWDGSSPGTQHMVKAARAKNLKLWIHFIY